MAFCEKCGKPVYRLDKTCVNCGAPVTQFSAPAKDDDTPRQSSYSLDSDSSQGSPYEVLSSWGFVGSMLLMALPFVEFIITIIWASGGATNLNRRNLARGYLILIALVAVIYVPLVLVLVSKMGSDTILNRLIQ